MGAKERLFDLRNFTHSCRHPIVSLFIIQVVRQQKKD
jgi:hypothetical protein